MSEKTPNYSQERRIERVTLSAGVFLVGTRIVRELTVTVPQTSDNSARFYDDVDYGLLGLALITCAGVNQFLRRIRQNGV